jgi:hypothetical protein
METQLRLAYTILYGDMPAQYERRRMDADHDGKISPDEARTFGTLLAQAIGQAATLEVDGARVPLAFEVADVGLGTDRGIGAAPFSVDLVQSVPIARGQPHRAWFDDHYPLPHPGDFDVVLEEAPGTRISESHRGREGNRFEGLKWTFSGPRISDLEDRSVGFTCVPDAGHPPPALDVPTHPAWSWLLPVGAVAIALAWWLLSRKSRKG